MKTIFWCLLFMVIPIMLIAQEQTENLDFKRESWSYGYYVGDQQISFDVFMKRLNDRNVTEGNLFRSGRNLSMAGMVVGSIGALGLSYEILMFLAVGRGNTALQVGGGGVLVAGIIMSEIGQKKMRKALTLFRNNSTSLYATPTQTGVGLCLNF